MSANERQVAGSHYARGGRMQHWDLIELNGIGYLEGCATKYVTRWRFKGRGVEDLEKAIHYLQKAIELWNEHNRLNRKTVAYIPFVSDYILQYGLTQREGTIINLILHWEAPDDLAAAIDEIRELIAEAA